MHATDVMKFFLGELCILKVCMIHEKFEELNFDVNIFLMPGL